MKIEPLEHKHRYRFRVRAVNKIGRSDPCEMLGDDILIKDPWGEWNWSYSSYINIISIKTYLYLIICHLTSLLNIVVIVNRWWLKDRAELKNFYYPECQRTWTGALQFNAWWRLRCCNLIPSVRFNWNPLASNCFLLLLSRPIVLPGTMRGWNWQHQSDLGSPTIVWKFNHYHFQIMGRAQVNICWLRADGRGKTN